MYIWYIEHYTANDNQPASNVLALKPKQRRSQAGDDVEEDVLVAVQCAVYINVI